MGTDRVVTSTESAIENLKANFLKVADRHDQIELIKALAAPVAMYIPNNRGADGYVENLLYITGEIIERLAIKNDAD